MLSAVSSQYVINVSLLSRSAHFFSMTFFTRSGAELHSKISLFFNWLVCKILTLQELCLFSFACLFFSSLDVVRLSFNQLFFFSPPQERKSLHHNNDGMEEHLLVPEQFLYYHGSLFKQCKCFIGYSLSCRKVTQSSPHRSASNGIYIHLCTRAMCDVFVLVTGTEHFLYALCHSDSRALAWIAKTTFDAQIECGERAKSCNAFDPAAATAQLKTELLEWLDHRPIWKLGKQKRGKSLEGVEWSVAAGESEYMCCARIPPSHPIPFLNYYCVYVFRFISGDATSPPPYSPAMSRVLALAQQIGGRPVMDSSTEPHTFYENGLVASEFLLAALLLEGTGVAVDALTYKSHGRVNSRSLLEAISLPLDALELPPLPGGRWEAFTLGEEGVAPSSGSAVVRYVSLHHGCMFHMIFHIMIINFFLFL